MRVAIYQWSSLVDACSTRKYWFSIALNLNFRQCRFRVTQFNDSPSGVDKPLHMRRIGFLVFTCFICAAASSHAQVSPSAYRGQLSLTAGGMGSVFQPDYAGNGVPESGPQRLFG